MAKRETYYKTENGEIFKTKAEADAHEAYQELCSIFMPTSIDEFDNKQRKAVTAKAKRDGEGN